MITVNYIRTLVGAITYKPGWTFDVKMDGDRPYIQASVSEESELSLDSVARDGSRQAWKSGKRYLSFHMCRQEVVGSVLSLIKDAEMHETLEWFRYRGASIYNPHLDPDVLVEVARKKSSFITRENAMTMIEDDVAVKFEDITGLKLPDDVHAYVNERVSVKDYEAPSERIYCTFPNCQCSSGAAEHCGHPPDPRINP